MDKSTLVRYACSQCDLQFLGMEEFLNHASVHFAACETCGTEVIQPHFCPTISSEFLHTKIVQDAVILCEICGRSHFTTCSGCGREDHCPCFCPNLKDMFEEFMTPPNSQRGKLKISYFLDK